jgi:SAM-dependent methyltransferase
MELEEYRNKELAEFRGREIERRRVDDLMSLLPQSLDSVLDIGARDGFISRLLAGRARDVTALDLEKPVIDDQRIRCVKGDVTCLEFPDDTFDLVLCAEVLEHIPTRMLRAACVESGRVAREYLLVGVPYKQDLRHSRTTCYTCGEKNPPWGHVNSFDKGRLRSLFPDFEVIKVNLLGTTDARTNFLSSHLMNLAGNPYGTYWQEEPCVRCGAMLISPPERNFWRKGATKVAVWLDRIQQRVGGPRPGWIHILFKKKSAKRTAPRKKAFAMSASI